MLRVANEDIFEADIEGAVGVRSEGMPRFAYDVFGFGVIVAYRVLDLKKHTLLAPCHCLLSINVYRNGKAVLLHTCIFNICPSPLLPLVVVVTTTN